MSSDIARELAKLAAKQLAPQFVGLVSAIADELQTRGKEGQQGSLPKHVVSVDGMPVIETMPFFRALKQAVFGNIAVIGRRGQGKTALSCAICTVLQRTTYVIGIEQAPLDKLAFPATSWLVDDDLPDRITSLKRRDDPRVLLVDDASEFFSRLTYGTPRSVALEEIIQIGRHLNLVMIINTQTTAQMDKYVIDPDLLLLLKPPSLMFLDTERSFVRTHLLDGKKWYDQMPEDQWPQWVYVVKDSGKGMLQYKLPPGWDDSISRNKAPRG